MNEQIHEDAVIRSKNKRASFKTPQVTSAKADYFIDGEYDQLEKMLVRNAHNELKNDFNMNIERIRQEFGMTNEKMKKQISTLIKNTDKEKEEK